MTGLAAQLGVSRKTLEAWRGQGCPGLPPEKIDLAAIQQWAADTGKRAADVSGLAASKEAKLAEEIRKLRIRNERDEGALISRAWVADRIQKAAGEWARARLKFEAEAPVAMSAAHGDVASQRIVARHLADEVARILQSLHEVFAT